MNAIAHWKTEILALVMGIAIGGYVQGLRWGIDIARRDKQQFEETTINQKAVIARQALEFQRVNEIARQANQYAITIKGQSDDKQIIYRSSIKRERVGRECVPEHVAGRLLGYANRLRSDAMHVTANGINAARTDTVATTCRLTYAQAIYWLDPLLTALDEANSKLSSIRQIKGQR